MLSIKELTEKYSNIEDKILGIWEDKTNGFGHDSEEHF